MRITRIEIREYRCLRDVTIECGPLTALIGANGTGKSTVIRALEFFFGQEQVDDYDCWDRQRELVIEVAVTFADLPDSWVGTLQPFLSEQGELRLAKRSEPGESGRRVRFVSLRRQLPEFQPIRQAQNATEARALYGELRRQEGFQELPSARSQREVLTALQQWESEHPGDLQPAEDYSVTLGGGGAIDLGKLVDLVVIPAVRDAVADATDERPGPLRKLIERLVRPRLGFEEKFAELRGDLEARYANIVEETGESVLKECETTLSGRLARLAPSSGVRLEWEYRPPSIQPPTVRADIVEAGFAAEVGRQGHGVQRAYIFALLQELAAPVAAEGQPDTAASLLLLAIEEPELYQHPVRARLLAELLATLAAPSGGAPTQVIYATHSPLFVSLDRVEALRLLRLAASPESPKTEVTRVELDAAADELWEASGADGTPFDGETLKARLRLLTDTPVSEGFFAPAVALVEGEEDRAMLLAAAVQLGVDLNAAGVAVLPVGGKGNLDKPLIIFRQLGIPTYVVFDGDGHKAENKTDTKSNRRLLKLVGGEVVDQPTTQINATWACFEHDLAAAVHSDVGHEVFQHAFAEACDEMGFAEGGNKNPTVLSATFQRLHALSKESPTLNGIIGHLVDLGRASPGPAS